MREPDLQMLLDERAILRILTDYTRGADRGDHKLYESVYWPDATDDHVNFTGSAMEFVAYAFGRLTDLRSHLMLGQTRIDFESPTLAKVETYYRAYQEKGSEGINATEILVGGRYLDLFEKRGKEWRIKSRMMVVDFYQTGPTSSDWINGTYRKGRSRGERSDRDPLYTVLGVKRA